MTNFIYVLLFIIWCRTQRRKIYFNKFRRLRKTCNSFEMENEFKHKKLLLVTKILHFLIKKAGETK